MYRPLVEALHTRGLEALREHWQTVFELEGGEFEMALHDGVLELTVKRCPDIRHMQERGYMIAEHF